MRRLLALSLALALSACSIIDPASDDIPRKVLGEGLGEQVPEDFTAEGWMDDPTAELPDLVPDYRPAWWHEPHGAVVRGMDAATLLALMATDTPVNFEAEKDAEGGGGSDREVDRDRLIAIPASVRLRGEAIEWVCRLLDRHCVMREGVLVAKLMETRFYVLAAQPGNYNNSMSTQGLDSSLGSASVSFSSSPYDAIPRLIEAVLDDEASYFVNAETNELMVTARPTTHMEIEPIIKQFNRRMRQTVRMQVSVFEIKRTHESGFGVAADWRQQWDLSQNTVGLFESSVNSVLADQNIDITWGGGDLGPDGEFQVGDPSYSLALKLLNTVAEAAAVFDEKIESRANIITTTENTRTRSILRSFRTTLQADPSGLAQRGTEVEFDEITTGWSIAVQPTIELDGRITIRVALSRNDLTAVEPFSYGGGGDGAVTGNNLITDQINRMASITLRDGQARLISALSTREGSRTSSLFGGSGRDRESAEFAILVTARIHD